MHITPLNTNSYNAKKQPSFGAVVFCRGNVFKPIAEGVTQAIPVEALFLEPKDMRYIRQFAEKWIGSTKYGKQTVGGFLKRAETPVPFDPFCRSMHYIVVRPASDEFLPKNEPLCVASISRWYNSVDIEHIQASNKVIYPQEGRVSGCGEFMMYAIARIAKTLDSPEIKLISKNDGFYKRIFRINIDPRAAVLKVKRKTIDTFLIRAKAKFTSRKEPDCLPMRYMVAMERSSFPYEVRRPLQTRSW